MSVIELASSQSIRPFKSSEEYVYAMKEDLAEWLKDLYGVDVNVKNLVQMLQTGCLLCLHANNVTRAAADFLCRQGTAHLQLPTSGVSFLGSAQPSTFQARDNVSNFIDWCRTEMCIKDVLMFETDDLVLQKNEKNVVLCLLEVARRASRFGMSAPVLIQLEQEIEEEMRVQDSPEQEVAPKPGVPQKRSIDTQNLDEMVQCLTSRCTCPTQFPVVKISEGKYRVGDSNTLIFVRILRNHVMVRVGGGWDTLEHYLDKHDPCRCTSLTHKLAQYPVTPVHEIKARQCRPDGHATSETSLLLSRVQSPVDPIIWAPSGPSRIHRSDPGLRCNSSPTKPTYFKSKDDSVIQSTSRTSREPNRASPAPRLSSSLPRAQTQRPGTPLVLQKVDGQPVPKPQQDSDLKLGQTWTKTQFVSKLRQNAIAGTRNNQEVQSFSATANSMETRSGNGQPPTISVQESQNNGNTRKKPDFIRTFCPTKGRLCAISSGEAHARFVASTLRGHSTEKTYLSENTALNCLMNASYTDLKVTTPEPFQTLSVVGASHRNGNQEKRYLFTPPPISPAQEAVLYQSLEEEILSNLKQLDVDSDNSDSESERYCSSEIPLNSPDCSCEYQKPLSKTSNTFTKDATNDPSHLKVSRSSSSWSSLGSSSGKSRSLKKPERVPSIYKLKLRPCVRPRRDNRPDKKPTKIPRPVYYRRNQSDTTQSSGRSSSRASTQRSSRRNLKFSPRAGCGAKRQGERETVGDEEFEYWV